jgi:hypothetical protein
MTNRLTGRFDGKVIVLDGPVDLPRDQDLVLHVEAVAPKNAQLTGMPGDEFVRAVQEMKIPVEDLDEIAQAIEDGCERIDHDGW